MKVETVAKISLGLIATMLVAVNIACNTQLIQSLTELIKRVVA